jgi:hypothetical protein
MTTINNGAATAAAPVSNLHETRRQLAASKRSHPAGQAAAKRVAAAKKATAELVESMAKDEKPAKAAKAPAKKAPAKAAPAPAKQAGEKQPTKIRWVLDGEKDEKNRAAQHGTGSNGVTYAITGAGDEWTATATSGGKTAVLGEKIGHTKAYTVCVRHHAEALAA